MKKIFQVHYERWVMMGAVTLSFAYLNGCGQPPRPLFPENKEDSSLSSEPDLDQSAIEQPIQGVETLGLRIARGQSGRSSAQGLECPMDDGNGNVPELNDIKINKNNVFLPTPIVLPAGHDLYFVWPEEGFGSVITQAGFTHDVHDGNNLWTRNLGYTRAILDRTRHQWYFSIPDLFSGGEYYKENPLSAANSQVLKMELSIRDGSKINFEIRFRAAPNGPLGAGKSH